MCDIAIPKLPKPSLVRLYYQSYAATTTAATAATAATITTNLFATAAVDAAWIHALIEAVK